MLGGDAFYFGTVGSFAVARIARDHAIFVQEEQVTLATISSILCLRFHHLDLHADSLRSVRRKDAAVPTSFARATAFPRQSGDADERSPHDATLQEVVDVDVKNPG
jgi:hypothetical protein